MQTNNAIIIGSGIAGMATAIRLAVQGFSVQVFEKNEYPGGKLSLIEKDGYRFDAGPSLFTQPANIEALFSLAGEPMEKYFQYQPIDIACRYFYENGKVVNGYTNPAAFAAELHQQLGENEAAVLQYLRQAGKLYDKVGTIFLEHSLHRRTTWLHRRTASALAAAKPGYLFRSLHKHNQAGFASAEAVQLFNRFATYNGSNPYKAPAMLSLIPHLEHNEGTFYPAGGMISITNALYQLAKDKGVQFHFNTPVQRIMHHQGRVLGVVVNDQNIMAAVVVSNADAYFTWHRLLGNEAKATRVLRQERSSSALIFYWGIKRRFPQLHLHNIFFSSDYRQEFEHIFHKKQLFADPTVYVNITSKMEGGHAPNGKENWFVMVNVPANSGQDWTVLKQQARSQVLEKLSRIIGTDVAALIETEETLDPVLIESRTDSYMGSLYGTSSNGKLAAFFRHPNFSGVVKGLYFCGGSVHPGGGIPLCLKSAAIVSNLIHSTKTIQHQHT